jgi:X-Pro dipeptidyl-peptidase
MSLTRSLCLVPLLAACASAQTPTRAVPVFEKGLAQVVPAFADSSQWIRDRLWVETEFDTDGDGRRDRVHVTVTRPRQTQTEGLKVAAVYETSPYFAGTANARGIMWDVKHELGADSPTPREHGEAPYRQGRTRISESHVRDWVPRGFAVVHSESPGTGYSQGCPTVGGANESLAPKAVIDWINGRATGWTAAEGGSEVRADWATGKVGMTGTSYNGTLPLAAATTGVEGLAAIIPVAPNTSYYHYYRANGLVRSPGGYLGEDIDALWDFINSGDPAKRAYCAATYRDGELSTGMDRRSGDWNAFWAGRDYVRQLDKLRAATLMAHAFNDWNVMPEHSARVVEVLKQRGVPVQQYYHQGGHGGPPPFDLMNKWFSRYLYDVDNGVERDPKAWIVREGAPRLEPTPYADFPNPSARDVTLRVGAGGRGIGPLATSVTGSPGRETLIDDVSFSGGDLASKAESPNRLLYATPELAEAVHLSGTARITLRVAANKPAANLSVWLVQLPWTPGRSATATEAANVITRGWADPQNHASLRRSEPLVPGRRYELSFDLQPDDQVIAAGKRIALMVFASDRDFTLWPAAGTELTVDLDATSLTLPVVGGRAAFDQALGERR